MGDWSARPAREKRRGGNGNHCPYSKKDVVEILYTQYLNKSYII